MFYYAAGTIDELFLGIIDALLARGRHIAPRDLPTIELFPALLELRDPRSRMLLVDGRSINPAFAIAEALWIISGSDDPWIFRYNNRLRQYADGGVLRGAYGPRLRRWAGAIDQLELVKHLLITDPFTRRAVIQIYDPGVVSHVHSDVPCTIGHRFLIRDGKLHMFTTMRSQDVWLGFPYDVFSNTLLLELMADWVGVPLGHYYHAVDSLHLYERDLASARRVGRRLQTSFSAMEPITIDWENLNVAIQAVLDGTATHPSGINGLALVLQSYRRWTEGDHKVALGLAASLTGVLGEAAERWYTRLNGSKRHPSHYDTDKQAPPVSD